MRKAPKQKPPKRIVSKAEFASVQARRARQSLEATLLILTGIFCSGIAVYFATDAAFKQGMSVELLVACLFGVLACFSLKWGVTTKKKVESEEVNIAPLTRANIAELPAAESLIRASEERQFQDTVLLRAVEVRQDDHEEQLLRAVTGERE